MISVSHLSKRYGKKLAVDDVSFEVDKGEVVGFLGPNGAGKSTTLKIISGFLGSTSGTVVVAGHDIKRESFEARQKIGYMPEAVPLYPEMRVREYLKFRAELKRVPSPDRAAFVKNAMEKAHVDDVAETVIGHLSKGYKQRVGLADALVAKPPLLVLDEPTAGLDPNQIREVRDVIKALGKEHTVLLSTHILSEVEASCTRVVVIARGKLVAAGTMEEIGRKRRAAGALLSVRGALDTSLAAIKSVKGVAKADATLGDEDDVFMFRAMWSDDLDETATQKAAEDIVTSLVKAGCYVREVRPLRGTLEEVFTELTR